MNSFLKFCLGLIYLVIWSLFWSWVIFGWMGGGEFRPVAVEDVGGWQP